MAYLNTQLSKQELGFVVDTMSTQKAKVKGSETLEVAENSNFYIASQLKEEKQKLISALAQFPVTAVWLLRQYEQADNTLAQDDDMTADAEITTDLSNVNQCFQILLEKSNEDVSSGVVKQNLMNALQEFPFSFSDLTKLVDLVVYAYKYRGLCYQPNGHHGAKKSDLIIRRLEGINRRSTINQTKLNDLLSSFDEQFLFLSSAEMHKHFADVVFAENRWLALRQQIATANSRLVLFIANQYRGNFLDFDDLVQEGHTGLLKAVDKFDFRLGFQFSTYAGYWIRQAISRALSRNERVVRVPCGQVANINKVFRTKDQFVNKEGREPTMQELADITKLSVDEVNNLLAISQSAMAIEGYDDDGESVFAPIDFIEQYVFKSSYNQIAQTDLEKLLIKSIGLLNDREVKVICSHFGFDQDNSMTLQEIGCELNLTRERVRQIQVIALEKIRRNLGEELQVFL
jgi:RNA polymerase sigma factor, sigma-70 family